VVRNKGLFLHERIRLNRFRFTETTVEVSPVLIDRGEKHRKLLYPGSSPYTTRVECLEDCEGILGSGESERIVLGGGGEKSRGGSPNENS